MKRKYDVIVIGGGIVGLSTAYFCAQAGAEVLVLEKGRIENSAASVSAGLLAPSHCAPLSVPGNVRQGISSLYKSDTAVRIRFRPDPYYLKWILGFLKASASGKRVRQGHEIWHRLHREGMEVHRSLAEIGGSEYQFRDEGHLALFITRKTFQAVAAETEHVKRFGVETKILSTQEVREIEPFATDKVVGGVLYPGDAVLAPRAFLTWLGRTCREAGVEILTDVEVFGFRTSGPKATEVRTTRGEFRPEQVVLAAGAWLARLTALAGRRLPVEAAKGYNLVWSASGPMPRRPIMMEDKRVVLSPYSDHINIVSTLDTCGLNLDIETRRLEQMMQAAGLYVSCLNGLELKEVRRGLRPCLPDGVPLAGRLHPGGNIFVAGGHDQKGVTVGPATGRRLALLLDGKSLGGLEKDLDPKRFF